ncbi:hypothetical protein KI387_013950, partial [Taxus chinensis]
VYDLHQLVIEEIDGRGHGEGGKRDGSAKMKRQKKKFMQFMRDFKNMIARIEFSQYHRENMHEAEAPMFSGRENPEKLGAEDGRPQEGNREKKSPKVQPKTVLRSSREEKGGLCSAIEGDIVVEEDMEEEDLLFEKDMEEMVIEPEEGEAL